MTSPTFTVAVVIPCYQVEDQIRTVIESLPEWVTYIVAVNDASTDRTAEILRSLEVEEPRLKVLQHEVNQGVGGAMITGFKEALRIKADFIIKMDGDEQMRADDLGGLLAPLLDGRADFAKGNRFRNPYELARMPRVRLVGNIILTFLTKAASGCWHVVDVQNGFIAVTREVLAAIPLDRLERDYCFENSLLAHAATQSAAIIDVPIPAVYGNEVSNLKISRVLVTFPPKLVYLLFARLLMRHVVHDLSTVAIYVSAGIPLLLFGVTFGGINWWRSSVTGVPATTGTVVLALLTFLLGFILLLQAIDHDIRSAPRPRSPLREITDQQVPSFFVREAPETTRLPD